MEVSLSKGFTLVETAISSSIALYSMLALVLIYQQSATITKAQLHALTKLNIYSTMTLLEHSQLNWFPTSADIQAKHFGSMQINQETYNTMVNYAHHFYADTNMDGVDDTWLTLTESNDDTVQDLITSSVLMVHEQTSSPLEGPTSVSLHHVVFSD